MSLAQLFYLKETFRERVRQWRLASLTSNARRSSFLKHLALLSSSPVSLTPHASLFTSHVSRFTLEPLEPRLLLSATPIQADLAAGSVPLASASVTALADPQATLDIDLSGTADALTDGVLITRYLFGFTGTTLTDGAVDPIGQRVDPTEITAYLESIRPSLDVDLNGQADALTDGVLITRHLFGFTGTTLTEGAVDPAGQRTDPVAIATYLDTMIADRDTLSPVVTAGLQQDTGVSATDGITNNPTITGTVTDLNAIVSFTAGLDSTPVANYTDVLSTRQPDGAFTLSTVQLSELAGGTLADGTHTLHLRASDALGNTTILDRTFTLDTQAPLTPTFDLALTSDTGTVGDQQTTASVVTLKGQTDPTTSVQVVGSAASTQSNGTGAFQFSNLTLAVGANTFTLGASDVAGNQSEFSRVITRLTGTQQADVVLTWTQAMVDAIQRDATVPPMASRGMAMVSLAMYDTINAIDGIPGYYVSLAAQPGTDPNAAAAAAAHRILSYLYPGQQAQFDDKLATSLASTPDGSGKTNGLALGKSVAEAIIAIRATDGWDHFVDYVPGTQPGRWQPTAPMFDVALLPQWANLTPFALTSPEQFRPAGPPALDSAAYTATFNEVKTLGSATGSTRTAEQTEIARFWADGAGTATPPGHWNQIAEQLALQQGNSLSANARLFAQLNVALADAGITAWNTKYNSNFWRPITAIQQADTDGNAKTTSDATWTSLLITPPFPEYVSGHSTYSGAAAEILTDLFGANVAFSTTTRLGSQDVTRSFTSFEQAAQEAGRSRIYGGIHFEFSNQDGLAAGRQVADHVLSRFSVTTDQQGPTIILNQQSGTVTKTNLTLTGQVLDNLSGVAALQAKLDNGTFAPITLSPTGTFSLPTTLALDGTADGLHTVTFQATDNQNNVSSLAFTFTLDTKAPTLTLTSPADNATLTVTTRLTGTADGTGSKLVELSYKFDNGTVVPVSFDHTTGSLYTTLDLSKLGTGTHTLTLRAQDQAGNVTTVTKNVTLPTAIPLTIIGVTPQAGASDVGSTFRPQVFFSRPVNVGTLNSNNFYATDTTGTKLPATIVRSQDGTFAWLFMTNPMPGASTITLHVDGTTILAASGGQALDADGNGQPGGVFTSTFSTVSLVPVPGTTITGRVFDPGPDLKPMTFDDIRAGADGILHTDDDVFLNPIAHAKVFIVGLESQAVFTDAQGNFTITNVPGGNVKVAVDGRTATNAPAGVFFPEMVMDATIEPGLPNTLMGSMGTAAEQRVNETRGEVYLPRLESSILQNVSNTGNTTIGVDAASAPNLTQAQRKQLQLIVQPGSLIDANGNPITNGQVGISTVPPELVRDMLPPGVLQHTFDITIQAPGVAAFNTPLQITFPNTFNAAPGTKLNFLSFDHTTGKLVIEGTATVSADGLSVTTDPGQGITKPGWHGLAALGNWLKGILERIGNCVNPEVGEKLLDLARQDLAFVAKSFSTSFNVAEAFHMETQGLLIDDAWTKEVREFATGIQMGTISILLSGLGDQLAHGEIQESTKKDSQHFIESKILKLVPGHERLVKTEEVGFSILSIVSGFDEANKQLDRAADAFVDLGRALQKCLTEPLDPGASSQLRSIGDGMVADITHAQQLSKGVLRMRDILDASPGGNITDPGTIASLRSIFTDIENARSYFQARNVASPGEAIKSYRPLLQAMWERLIPAIQPVLTAAEGAYLTVKSLDGQTIFSGRTDNSGAWEGFLPPNQQFQVYYYDPSSNLSWSGPLFSGVSGATLRLVDIVLSDDDVDADDDGLGAVAEEAVGTKVNARDTDNDGLSDFIEIQQGLDPLGGRGLSTGVTSAVPLQGEAKAVVLEGSPTNAESQTAYVAIGTYGLAIVDASQFQKPVVLSQLDLPGDTVDVSVDSSLGIAAVASGTGGLHFVNVSTPTIPTVVRTIALNASQVEVFEGIVYAAVGSEVQAYDLLTGEKLSSVAGTANITGLAREGSMLYTMDSGRVLRAIEIGTDGMIAGGTLAMPSAGSKLFVGNGIAYVAAGNGSVGGFMTANVSSPDVLTLISGIDAANVEGQALAVNGSGLAVSVGRFSGPGGQPIRQVHVLDVRDPANTAGFVTAFDLSADPFDVAIGAGIAFVADGTGGLQIVNYRSFDNQGVAPTVTAVLNAVDIDPATPGVQLQEGSTVALRSTVTDDVQVRNVELLVNGQVVRNDVAFPFDMTTALPTIAANGSNQVSLQIRATDTGGNVGLSTPITIQLVPDTFAPTITGLTPVDGSNRGQAFRTVTVSFSEAMDLSTLTAANIQLIGPNGAVTPANIQVRSGDRMVQLTYDPLVAGNYQIVINQAGVKDRAGNSVGTGTTTSQFTILLATAVFNNSTGNGFWDVAANWDGGVLPTATDDVLLNAPDGHEVIFRTGTATIRSLTSATPFTLSGGTLTVEQTVQVNNTFNLSGGTLKGAKVLAGSSGEVTVLFRSSLGNPVPSRLDGVTLETNLGVAAGARLIVTNGLTLNGVLTLGSAGSSSGALVDFEGTGTQTLGSTGRVVFGGPGSNHLVRPITTGGTLVIGPGMVIEGGTGGGFVGDGTLGLRLEGQVRTAGRTITLAGNWTTVGTSAGTIDVTGGGTVNLGGTFTTADLDPVRLKRNATSTLVLTGTLTNTNQTLTLEAGPTWQLGAGQIIGGKVAGSGALTVQFVSFLGSPRPSRLDGVTLEANLSVAAGARLIVTNGLTLNGTLTLGTAGSSSGALVDFEGIGAQTVGGTGRVVFGGTGSNNQIRPITAGGTLVIGPGIEVEGGTGGGFVGDGTLGLQIQGQVRTAGRTITMAGNWTTAGTNPGTIDVTGGGTVNLGGTFTTAELDPVRLKRNATNTLVITGTLTNTNQTLTLEAGPTWQLGAGRIIGGTVAGSGALTVQFNSFLGNPVASRLDGVTLETNLGVAAGARLIVTNGLTLNGVLTLGTAGSSSGALVDFEGTGTQTLGGTGRVVFGGPGSNHLVRPITTGGTLVIGPGMVIEGGTGGGTVGDGTLGLQIQGQVRTADRTITLAGNWTTVGTSAGTIDLTGGGTLNLGGTFTTADLDPARLKRNATSTLVLTGTLTNTNQTLTLEAGPTWQLAAGQIIGGTVAGAGMLGAVGFTVSRLDGVVLNANLLVAAGGQVLVSNGLTLNGIVTLTSVSPGTVTALDFEGAGTQTLGGTGRVVFGGTSSGSQLRPITTGATLVIGPGIVVEGGTGSGTIGSGTLGLLLQGQVRTAGRSITIRGTTVTNEGTLAANSQGGAFSVIGSLSNSGTVSITSGALISVTGNYTQTPTGSLSTSIGGTATTQFGRMTITGSATLNGTLNVSLANGYIPTVGDDPQQFMTFAARSGFFATQNGLDLGGGLAFQVETTDPLDLELVTVGTTRTSTVASPTSTALSSLASTQPSWLKEFVAGDLAMGKEDELVITLPK